MHSKLTKLLLYWIGLLVGNGLGFVISLLVNRGLDLTEFGYYGLLTNSIMLVSIVTISIGITANRFAARDTDTLDQALLSLHRIGVAIGLIITGIAVMAIFSRPDMSMSSLDWVILAGGVLLLMFPIAWFRHMLLAYDHYFVVTLSVIIDAFLKMVIIVLLLPSYNFEAIVLGFFISSFIIWGGLQLVFERKVMRSVHLQSSLALRRVLIFLGSTLLLRIASVLASGLDVVVASFWLESEQLGVYALLSVIGKMVFFIGQTAYMVMTPALSGVIDQTNTRRRVFGSIVSLSIIAMSVVALLILSFGGKLLMPLVGQRWFLITEYLPAYLLAIGMLTLLLQLSLYYTLKEQTGVLIWLYVSVATYLLVSTFLHTSVAELVQSLLYSVAMALVAIFFWRGWLYVRSIIPAAS